jgi:hypothetical protein
VASVYRHTAAGDSARWWSVRIRALCGIESAPASIDPLSEVLGCSERQAKRVTGRARELGLVRARPAGRPPARDGVQDSLQPGEWLEYQIDWTGVRRLIGFETTRQTAAENADWPQCQPVPSECQPVPSECQPGPSECQPGPSECQPGPSHIRNTRAPAGPVPVPDRVFERKQYRSGTGAGAAGPRLLDAITLGTLSNTRELVDLFAQVCQLSPIAGVTDCEADQLWWLSVAECSLRVGRNPVSYFRYVVQRGKRDVPKLMDEDRARKRLKELDACLT